MHSCDDSGIHFQEVFGRYCLLIGLVHFISILKPGWGNGMSINIIPFHCWHCFRVIVISAVLIVPVVVVPVV